MNNLFTPMNPDEELDPITGLPILKTEPAMQSQGSVQDLLKSLNAVQPTPDSVEPKIDVRDYLMRKYNLGNYDDNARQELQKQTDLNGGDYLSAGLMGLGAAFQGKDSGSAISNNLNQRQSQKNQKLDQFEKGRLAKIQEIGLDRDLAKYEREDRDDAEKQVRLQREKDPSSEESKMAQALAKKMQPNGDYSNLTAAKFKDYSPAMEKMYKIEQDKIARQEAREARSYERQTKRDEKDAVLRVEGFEVAPGYRPTAKDAETIKGLNTANKNIGNAIDKLDALVGKSGSEIGFGDDKEDMEAAVTDVQMQLKELQNLGVLSGPDLELLRKQVPDPTALKSWFAINSEGDLKRKMSNFKATVGDKLNNAAISRGYQPVGKPAQDSVSTKAAAPTSGKAKQVTQNGHTYTLNEQTGKYE